MNKDKKFLIISFLIFCNLVALSIFLDLRKEQDLEVTFFDVGQGDAALIRTSDRKNILIDGGPEDKILSHLSSELPFWDRDIDLIILTHPHADHLSGLVEVLERFNVEKVLWTKQSHDSLVFREWESLLEKVDDKKVYRGQRVYLGEAYLDILFPPKDFDFSKGLNEASIVNRLVHEDGSVLFTGDAGKRQEEKLLEWEKECSENKFDWCRAINLPSDVLKVSHHGSASSSGYDFVKRVNPEVAVISAGADNRHGHPHEEVLKIFNDLSIDTHKTFEEGNFKVIAE
ncbi:MAG: ComEC/Rec2 family competence protein [Patescibacteria group bacterium]